MGLRVGNGAGFWGDNVDAPVLLAQSGRLDVLTLEYLAELTMAILAHLKSKDAHAGYVTDFPDLIERLAPALVEQPGLRIVTNAGGLNPVDCARRCGRALEREGLSKATIGVVTGDDVLGPLSEWRADGLDFAHFETGQPITAPAGALASGNARLVSSVLERLVCANAYLGARPIVEALEGGARIVVTGRVADASLTVGPSVQALGWRWDQWGELAGASVAGHLIECGAQATGGLWHRWDTIDDLANVGYPIAEIEADGSCVITKPEGSGGLVTVANVTEQLVYEIDDPACYRTPDVDVDLTSVRLSQAGPSEVAVRGARGKAPTDYLKVSAVYRDGWTASGMLAVVGRNAEAKARACGRIVLERLRRSGFEVAESLVEVIGAGDVVPGVVRPTAPPFEVALRITARDPRREAIARFCKEFAPLITAGPPGIAGYATGRPEPRPAFGYWPTLVPRSLVTAAVKTQTAAEWAHDHE